MALSNPLHRNLLQRELKRAKQDTRTTGVMLQGSLARGDGDAGSDLDLFLLIQEMQSSFSSEIVEGVLVERHSAGLDYIKKKCQQNPTLVYGFLDGRVLYDPQGELAELVCYARELLRAYRTPPEVMEGIRH
jgi:predicted nucleotidyltransferase